MRAHRRLPVATGLLLCVLVAPARCAPPKTREWPGTEAARHAQAWFRAYNTGEAAMRDMYAQHYSQGALASRPIEARLTQYRQMHEENGAFTPAAIAGG